MEATIWNFSSWITETNPKKLRTEFGAMLKKAGFNVVNLQEHYFVPFGYTALWLLSESHFAIHTFPEYNRTYVELSSCNQAMYDKFVELIEKDFDTIE